MVKLGLSELNRNIVGVAVDSSRVQIGLGLANK